MFCLKKPFDGLDIEGVVEAISERCRLSNKYWQCNNMFTMFTCSCPKIYVMNNVRQVLTTLWTKRRFNEKRNVGRVASFER